MVDLVAVMGYYGLVSMTLNADRYPDAGWSKAGTETAQTKLAFQNRADSFLYFS